jgi:trehalose-phosphatase
MTTINCFTRLLPSRFQNRKSDSAASVEKPILFSSNDRFVFRNPEVKPLYFAGQSIKPKEFIKLLKKEDKSSRKILLCSDIDGTLTPFQEKVEDARLTEKQVTTLIDLAQKLEERYNTYLAFVTGRKFADALHTLGGKDKLHGKSIVLVTDQGLKTFNCKKWQDEPISEAADIIKKAEAFQQIIKPYIDENCTPENGFCNVEYKVAGLAVNLNKASKEDVQALRRAFDNAAEKTGLLASNQFKIVEEKGVLEIKPCNFNKGTAIKGLKKVYLPEGGTSVFMGDSQTDNPGFEAVDLSLYVGKPNDGVKATHEIRNTEDTEDCKKANGTIDQEKRTRISKRNTKAVHQVINGFYDFLNTQSKKQKSVAKNDTIKRIS